MNNLKPIVALIPVAIIIALFVGKKYNLREKFPKANIVINIALGIAVLVVLLTIYFNFGIDKDRDKGWAVNYMNYKSLYKLFKGKSQKIALIDTGISKFEINKDDKSIVYEDK